MPLIAVDANDVDEVGDRIEIALGIALERRDSDYLGPYRKGTLKNAEIQVYANSDPLFQSGIDDPEEEWFKPAFKEFGVLIDTEADDPAIRSLQKLLLDCGYRSIVI